MRSLKQTDILTGSIPKQLLLFFLPIWFGTLFQQLYNTADTLIVGNLVGTNALAAVGATGAFVNLLVGLFVGLCSGAGVVIAQSWGAHDPEAVDRQVHTALVLSVGLGALLTVLGFASATPMMRLMGTPEEILADSALYLRIYSLGMIPQMLYNMGTNILRAIGDSKRPLYFLIAASLVNIVLDVVFIAVFGWGVAGAALATVFSQVASAVLTLRCIAGSEGTPWHIRAEKLRLHTEVLAAICMIGIPAAAQSAMYNVSNMLIQSSMNSFGTSTIAAWGVYGKIDFLFWMTINSLGIAITTFAGQNFGARQYDRDGGGHHAGHQRGILQRGRAAVPAVQSGRCGRCGGRGYDACADAGLHYLYQHRGAFRCAARLRRCARANADHGVLCLRPACAVADPDGAAVSYHRHGGA